MQSPAGHKLARFKEETPIAAGNASHQFTEYEVAEIADAAMRLCDLLADRSTTADVAYAAAELRKAMKGLRAREYVSMLKDSGKRLRLCSESQRSEKKKPLHWSLTLRFGGRLAGGEDVPTPCCYAQCSSSKISI